MTFSIPYGYTIEEAHRAMAAGWNVSFSDEVDLSIYKTECCRSCCECLNGRNIITSCPLCGSDFEPYRKKCECGIRLRWCSVGGRHALSAFGIPFELIYGITDEVDTI